MTNLSEGSIPNPEATSNFLESPTLSPKPTYDDIYYRSTVGGETAEFYRKLRERELLPIQDFTQFETISTFNGYREYQTWDAQSGGSLIGTSTHNKDATNSWTNFESISDFHLSEAELEAEIDINLCDNVTTRAIVGLTTSIHDSATFVAELNKTVRMFRKAIPNFVKILNDTKPKDWSRAWLEGRYGWRVLLFDLKSIDEAWNNLSQSSEFYTSRSKSSSSSSSSDATTNQRQDADMDVTIEKSFNVSYRGLAVSKITPPSFGGDPLVTAWELVPFSFVIDWFVDVGTKLSYISGRSLGADIVHGYGAQVTASGQGRVRVNTLSARNRHDAGGGLYLHLLQNIANVEMSATLTHRRSYTPSLLPTVQVRLDSAKVVDLLALVYQALAR